MSKTNLAFLGELEKIVETRLQNPSSESYTAQLASAGTRRIAQKVGEEGVELALAATTDDRFEIVDEAADLIFHVIVLLARKDIPLSEVVSRLESRHAES